MSVTCTGSDLLQQSLQAPVHEADVVTPVERMQSLSGQLGNPPVEREDRRSIHSFKI